MAEQGFPNQHTTTTTVTSSNTTVQTNLRFDPLYIRTIPGMLKVAQIEFVFCALWTFFYLIAAPLAADYGRVDEAFAAAAFFGFCAMIAYGCDAFLKFNAIRSGALAQGERVVSKTTSTVTSPAY